MAMNLDKDSGFTLIEVMIVVVIIAIISAIALPSYQNYARESRRTEGTSELTKIMGLQERYFTNRFPPSYTVTLTQLGYSADPVVTENTYYSVRASLCAGEADPSSCILLTATAQGGQADDGNLTLDSRGNKTRDGTGTSWD